MYDLYTEMLERREYLLSMDDVDDIVVQGRLLELELCILAVQQKILNEN